MDFKEQAVAIGRGDSSLVWQSANGARWYGDKYGDKYGDNAVLRLWDPGLQGASGGHQQEGSARSVQCTHADTHDEHQVRPLQRHRQEHSDDQTQNYSRNVDEGVELLPSSLGAVQTRDRFTSGRMRLTAYLML